MKVDREVDINPLSARAFFGAFFKYRKFDFVTQFLRNGSTKMQSFVYHFVENFKLLQENDVVEKKNVVENLFTIFTVSRVTAVRSDHGVMSYIPDIGT